MKHYPVQFKADAVALYRSRPGATLTQIADDLGINREALRSWVRADDQCRGATAGPAASAARPQVGGSFEEDRRAPVKSLDVVFAVERDSSLLLGAECW